MKNAATMEATQTPQSVLDALAYWSVEAHLSRGVAPRRHREFEAAARYGRKAAMLMLGAPADRWDARQYASCAARAAFRAVPALRGE